MHFIIIYIIYDYLSQWNEKWVSYAAESTDSCNMYIVGLLVASAVLIMGSISAIGVMFWQFGSPGCSDNLAVISLTLSLSVLVTIFQLFLNEEYSLLSSAMMMAYTTYICFATVTLNPTSSCNPTLATGYQVVQEAIGMAITVLSLIWSTQTAVQRLQELSAENDVSSDPDSPQDYNKPGLQALFVESTIVFILISCYYGMVLTNWATLQNSDSINNPKTGTASFWLQASAQWICLLLYVWALLAPKIFPDRDFGRQQ